VIALSLR